MAIHLLFNHPTPKSDLKEISPYNFQTKGLLFGSLLNSQNDGNGKSTTGSRENWSLDPVGKRVKEH